MNWSALSEALDITTEMRPVYRLEHVQSMPTSMEASRNHSGRTVARLAAMTDYHKGE